MASTCAAPVTGHILAATSFAGAHQSQVAARPGALSSSFVGRPALRVQSPLHTAFTPPSSPDAACPRVGQLQVRAAKRSRFNNGGRGPGGTAQQGPPPIDFGADDNPKFILFVRATGGAVRISLASTHTLPISFPHLVSAMWPPLVLLSNAVARSSIGCKLAATCFLVNDGVFSDVF